MGYALRFGPGNRPRLTRHLLRSAAARQGAGEIIRKSARALRSAMSTWKWFLCALLASGPSTVPKMPHAARWAARRNWALPVRGSAAGRAGWTASPCCLGPPRRFALVNPRAVGAGRSRDLHGDARHVDGDAGAERLLAWQRAPAPRPAGCHSSAWLRQPRLRLLAASGQRQPAPRSRGRSDPNRQPPWSSAPWR